MIRKYPYPPNNHKPLSFKAAFLIVIGLHLFGGTLLWSGPKIIKQINSNSSFRTQTRKSEIGPRSDALAKNWSSSNSPIKQTTKTPTTVKTPATIKTEPAPIKKIDPIPELYVLQPGDNFYSVSRKLNVSFSELANYNNIQDVRTLRPGQTLKVPKDS